MIHGAVGVITFLRCLDNNEACTVLTAFTEAVQHYGLPTPSEEVKTLLRQTAQRESHMIAFCKASSVFRPAKWLAIGFKVYAL